MVLSIVRRADLRTASRKLHIAGRASYAQAARIATRSGLTRGGDSGSNGRACQRQRLAAARGRRSQIYGKSVGTTHPSAGNRNRRTQADAKRGRKRASTTVGDFPPSW